jgi:hypothetical protein
MHSSTIGSETGLGVSGKAVEWLDAHAIEFSGAESSCELADLW